MSWLNTHLSLVTLHGSRSDMDNVTLTKGICMHCGNPTPRGSLYVCLECEDPYGGDGESD